MDPLYNTLASDSTATATAAVSFPMEEPFASWDLSAIQGSIETQKFLAAAIAKSNQYVYDEDSKRKLELLEDITTQIPAKANHNLNITSVPHDLSSQAEDTEQSALDDDSQDQQAEQKKKPGRKPLTNAPNTKRKAQNRAAQRAFRERKERYVKELETKIKELESQTAKSAQENQQLKNLASQLQTENFILKQSAFAFDFTLDEPSESALALDKNINDLVWTGNSVDPFTPPPSDEETAKKLPDSGVQPVTGLGSSSKEAAIFNIDPPQQRSSISTRPQDAQESSKPTDSMFLGDLNENGDKSTSNDNSSSSNGRLLNTNSPGFTQYRDTANIDDSLDDDLMSNYVSMPQITEIPESESEAKAKPCPTLDKGKTYLSCNKAWERIHEHPKYDDFADEIDKLCDELKSKAKCSGNGPVVPEDEVAAILAKLEEKN